MKPFSFKSAFKAMIKAEVANPEEAERNRGGDGTVVIVDNVKVEYTENASIGEWMNVRYAFRHQLHNICLSLRIHGVLALVNIV
jgi:hypothetical protein